MIRFYREYFQTWVGNEVETAGLRLVSDAFVSYSRSVFPSNPILHLPFTS